MATDAVYSVIKAYLSTPGVAAMLEDSVTGVVPPIRFENEEFSKPNPPAPWISMALTGVLYSQQSIGASDQADNRWDETGHLFLPVFVRAGSGSERARQLAKLLADLFRGRTLLEGSLEFLDAMIGEGQPAEEDGNWYELPVVIEWRRLEA